MLAAAGFAAAQLTAAAVDWSQLPPASTATGVTFDKDIAPMFQASCVRCHSGDRARGQLHLDTLAGVLKGTKEGPVLTPGDSANSLLVKSISRLDPRTAMPPAPRLPRRMGTNAPPMRAGGPAPGMEGAPQGTNGMPMQPRFAGAKPLTPEQVGLVRAWIDQGAK
jgi:hypothetical protein